MCEETDKVDRLLVAARIRRRRIDLRYNQATLAKALGVSPHTVAKWEQAVKQPSAKNRERLCVALGLNHSKLFG